jgi:uncharacterized protein with ATP-grasp and redox domains
MKTSLDCIPCLLRQTLEAARRVSKDLTVHEQMMREISYLIGDTDLQQSPPAIAQHVHRRLRQITGITDPYRDVKAQQNRMALKLLPELRKEIQASTSPLNSAVRIATMGNVIDMGAQGNFNETDMHQSIKQSASTPFYGDFNLFAQAISSAHSILYLADNAGEIAFDRLLIEQISPERVTLVVRGAPVLNDATLVDAQAVGLDKMVEVIDNGSDAPGTLLEDCSLEFRRRFVDADLIIAKGQGNFETLNQHPGYIFYLLKVKCSLVANHIHQPVGMHALVHSNSGGSGNFI